ncbi:Lsr2 family protein [Actinokineospora sp. NBRC 105648]|uniref:histone-like nucleoid-structuring protein Lsr2 n=1 Tax=Actinokineospora sp. NBRC 105648 TaxID=3032206 RepID=UPI0024A1649A|nr:Lsr2 family protein [Actinokineospora sp. NBRC 105648]GLZ39544.1 Lsr2 family protein [Actinokineospora sp. NBRC 105648]
MAQKTVVELVDDLDGGQADETVDFALDGVEFAIDLSRENAARLRESLAEFVGHARRTSGRKSKNGVVVVRRFGTGDRADNQAIREWARNQGETIAERGRIPQALVTKFQEAHGG